MTPGPYHLLSLGTLLLVSYFVSLLLLRFRLVPLQDHRKFWNTLLLIFFLSTASLGLLLVIKVNYKLNISWLEEAMQWHVDSGIGFVLLALFHLLWHKRYYLNRSKNQENPSITSQTIYSRWQYRTLFLLLGFISIMAQLVLLREFLKNFNGNELVIAIFLSAWMLLTAMGASLGSRSAIKNNNSNTPLLLILISAFPILVYLLLILVSRFLFLPGVEPGLLNTIVCIVLLIFPVTGISGFIFGSASRSIKNGQENSPYMLDAIGSLAGGVLFAAILVHLLNNLQLLTFLFLSTSLVLAGVYSFPSRPLARSLLLFAAIGIFVLSLLPSVQNKVEDIRYRNEKLLANKDTPYGNLSFTKANDQISAYKDGIPIVTTNDITLAEESVHYPALQLQDPKSFLLLGGGLSGLIGEAAKYNPDIIHCCEADPWIFRLGKVYLPEKSRLPGQFIPEDGRSWLMNSGDTSYDVIISNSGNPHNIGSNRYFTVEFYRLVREHLSPQGVFCMHLSTADNYINMEGLQMLRINKRTLKEVFTHVLIVPGSSTYFLASNRPLSLDIPGLLFNKNIPTTYVHPDYLDTKHMLFDQEQLSVRIEEQKASINSDLWPRLFFATLLGIQSKTGKHALEVAGILAVLIFFILLFSYSLPKRAMYVTGFSGAGIQIILIMVMQSFYGFAYLVAPMMITLFMAGIVVGVLSRKRIWKKNRLNSLPLLIFLMALVSLSGMLIPALDEMFKSRWIGQLLLGILNFVPGIVVGWVYSLGANTVKKGKQDILGGLFSADLTGAALGTLISAIFLLPLIGIVNTFILFFGINLVTSINLLLKAR